MYNTDTFRRVGLETLLPALLQFVNSRVKRSKTSKVKARLGPTSSLAQACDEFELAEYEQFDDYLEMVICFGYITLFASSFPLCAALSLVAFVVEIKSDLYKIIWVSQRPPSRRSADIGVWHGILYAQAWLAILPNVLIFGFTSNQMKAWFPLLFQADKTCSNALWVAIRIFSIEHVIGLLALAILFLIPDKPAWVVFEGKRLLHEKTLVAHVKTA